MDAQYLIGVFEKEETLIAAFRKMKEQGIEIEDVFTPYPIHEILEKHGKRSRITIVGWFYGFFASIGVLAFLFYTAVINWPLKYGGKPSNAFPSFIVITIVLTIFSITVLSLFTFSWRANLWPSNEKPIYHPKATDDKFVILVNKERVDVNTATSVMKESGAIEVIEK
jgi:Alternative complex III, ActD subunit